MKQIEKELSLAIKFLAQKGCTGQMSGLGDCSNCKECWSNYIKQKALEPQGE